MKHIERFRKMTNMVLRMEWIEKDPFAKYQQKFEKVERGYLTNDELCKIETRDLHLVRLQYSGPIYI